MLTSSNRTYYLVNIAALCIWPLLYSPVRHNPDPNFIDIIAFGGIIAAAAAWSIWGTDMFPSESDPTGNPEGWTTEEMRRWLNAVWFNDKGTSSSLYND
jgi:hypothetical protein